MTEAISNLRTKSERDILLHINEAELQILHNALWDHLNDENSMSGDDEYSDLAHALADKIEELL